jgi:hypothetical protein
MHAMTRTGNDAELCVLRPVGQIHLKTVPSVIDLVALRLREAGEGAAGSTFPSLEDDDGDIVAPGEVLLWRKQLLTLKAFQIHVGTGKRGGDSCISPDHLFVRGVHEDKTCDIGGILLFIVANENAPAEAPTRM